MRFRADIDDLEASLFNAEEAAERHRSREAERAERLRHAAELADAENKAAAIRAAKLAADSKRISDRFRIREYQAQGVEPIHVNDEGVPTISLALLLKLGWTIEDHGRAGRVLVRPLQR